MGYAVAERAARRGAAVDLVTTIGRPVDVSGIEVEHVETADDMARAVAARFQDCDVVVMAAAVADFRPKAVADEKLKKRDGVPDIVLEPTTDVLALLGERKQPGQLLVGFAAETDHLERHAVEKMAGKRVDMMVANDVSAPDAGFEVDTNRAILLYSSGSREETPLLDKGDLADLLLDRIAAVLADDPTGANTPHE
jgi:phosphopantothenoylcysteine decarboxylase/phosphopantothenate--cysteine ligase